MASIIIIISIIFFFVNLFDMTQIPLLNSDLEIIVI